MRLLSDVAESPLLNPAIPPEELRSRIRQIRSGFSPIDVPRAERAERTPAPSFN